MKSIATTCLALMVFSTLLLSADVRQSGIAECNFVYAVNGSEDCHNLAEANNYDLVKMMKEPELFQTCITSNCGKFVAGSGGRDDRESYVYKMEVEKECTKISEVAGDKLAATKWKSDAQEYISQIPYMTVKYKCPDVDVKRCVASERVTQSPVMCFKHAVSSSEASLAERCTNGDASACSSVNGGKGIADMIFWQYCDADKNGDLYPESLTPEQIATCNRSDAATLRCEKDSVCQTTAKCLKKSTISVEGSQVQACEDLEHHYVVRNVETNCGNIADPYTNDENCIRINSTSESRSKAGKNTYYFNSNGSQELDDYTEYLVYRKKADYQHDTILAALVMPRAFYRRSKTTSIFGVKLDDLFPWINTPMKISPYILDNHIASTKAMGFDINATPNTGYTYDREWTVSHWYGPKDHYRKAYIGKAYWNEQYASYTSTPHLVKKPNSWMPWGMNYALKVSTFPNEILAVYNVNDNRDNKMACPDIDTNMMASSGSCNAESGVGTGSTWKRFMQNYKGREEKASIYNMGLVIPFTGLYSFKFYNNSQYLFSVSKYFGLEDHTTHYPLSGVNLFGGYGGASVANSATYSVAPAITKAIDAKMLSVKSDIDAMTKELIEAFFDINKDQIDDTVNPKKLHEYTNSNGYRELLKNIETEKWLSQHYANDGSPCTGSYDPAKLPNVLDTDDETNLAWFETFREQSKYCLGVDKAGDINSTIDTSMASAISTRQTKNKYYGKLILSDFIKIKDNIKAKLAHAKDKYTITTSNGSTDVSYKSSCGDYENAKSDAKSFYDTGLSSFGTSHYGSKYTTLRDDLISIIDTKYNDVTLTYSYDKYKRYGVEEWDKQHTVAGYYYKDENNVTKWQPTRYYYGSIDENQSTDTPDDWDDGCTGEYYYYKSSDNFTSFYSNSGTDKTLSGVYQDYFSAAGAYSCDREYLTPTGDDDDVCYDESHLINPYYKHDGETTTAYTNTIDSSLSFTSTAKKYNGNIDDLNDDLLTWMEANSYKDSTSGSTYLSGDDNVLYTYLTTRDNAVDNEADKDIYQSVYNIIEAKYRSYYTLRYNNNDKFGIQGGEESSYVNAAVGNAYTTSVNGTFSPFNRIVIQDELSEPGNEFAMNFDITLPGGTTINQPQAFSFVFMPSKESRTYHCFTNWDACGHETDPNCKLTNTKYKNYITDGFGKRVPATKTLEYECKSTSTRDTCSDWEIKSTCNDFNTSVFLADYDDHDFTASFQKAIGEVAMKNSLPSLFGGKELHCDYGTFVDIDWLTDPQFWMQKILHFSTGAAQGGSDAMQGVEALAGKVTGNQCADRWAQCMNDAGQSLMDQISSLVNISPDSSGSACTVGTGSSPTGVSTSVQEKACDNVVQQLTGCKDFCYTCADEALKKRVTEQSKSSGGDNPFEGLTDSAIQALSLVDAFGGAILTGLLEDTYDRCDQCKSKTCAISHEPHESLELFKMTGGMSAAEKFSGTEYGMGNGITAYGNCVEGGSKCSYTVHIGKDLCWRHQKSFCCYGGKMARILSVQLYQQLGLSFKAITRPGANSVCEQLLISDLSNVDFKSCGKDNPIPSPSNRCVNYSEIRDYILNQANWDVEKSINMNQEVQNVLETVNDLGL